MYSEEAKAAVNNVCDLNGYLFLSMGQKLYARAFEQDEFLLAIGFLDVGVHVTTLTALKNFLLIGDEQQSISLVAFQVRILPSTAFEPVLIRLRRRTRTSWCCSVATFARRASAEPTLSSTRANSPLSRTTTGASSVSSSTTRPVSCPRAKQTWDDGKLTTSAPKKTSPRTLAIA